MHAFPTREKKEENKLKSLDEVLIDKQQLPPNELQRLKNKQFPQKQTPQRRGVSL